MRPYILCSSVKTLLFVYFFDYFVFILLAKMLVFCISRCITFFMIFLVCPAEHPRLILDDSIEGKGLGVKKAGGEEGGWGRGVLRLPLRTVG